MVSILNTDWQCKVDYLSILNIDVDFSRVYHITFHWRSNWRCKGLNLKSPICQAVIQHLGSMALHYGRKAWDAVQRPPETQQHLSPGIHFLINSESSTLQSLSRKIMIIIPDLNKPGSNSSHILSISKESPVFLCLACDFPQEKVKRTNVVRHSGQLAFN